MFKPGHLIAFHLPTPRQHRGLKRSPRTQGPRNQELRFQLHRVEGLELPELLAPHITLTVRMLTSEGWDSAGGRAGMETDLPSAQWGKNRCKEGVTGASPLWCIQGGTPESSGSGLSALTARAPGSIPGQGT